MIQLLTETADYDMPGSWGPASKGWPEIRGDKAYDMYVFANRIQSIQYGSYVLVAQRGQYGAKESCLRVHPECLEQLKKDFNLAGKPSPETSIARSEKYGKKNEWGQRMRAPSWVEKLSDERYPVNDLGC